MARAFSGVLGAIGLILVIVRGLLTGMLPNEILTQSLAAFAALAVVGYCIGFSADRTVCDSVENRFRREMARIYAAATEKNSQREDEIA